MSKPNDKHQVNEEAIQVSEEAKGKAISRRNFFKYAGVSAASAVAVGLYGCRENTPISPSGSLSVDTVNPASGKEGDEITIIGSQFSSSKSNNTVTIGGKEATVKSASGSKLVVIVPGGLDSGSYDVTVAVGGDSTKASTKFMYDLGVTNVDLGSGDVGILNTAYALEQLEAAFYATAAASIDSGDLDFGNAVKNNAIKDIAQHEKAHSLWFGKVLELKAPDQKIPSLAAFLDFDKASVDFSDSMSVLTAAHALEETGIGAYNGAGQYIQNDDYLVQAGKIVSVEARHTSIINTMLKPNDATYFAEDQEGSGSTQFGIDENGLDTVLTVEQAVTNAAGFLNTDKLKINFSNVGK